MVLSLLLAFALWQKARDRLPYLLDADVAPPARVSTSDGLIAAMVFFVVAGRHRHGIGGVAGGMIRFDQSWWRSRSPAPSPIR